MASISAVMVSSCSKLAKGCLYHLFGELALPEASVPGGKLGMKSHVTFWASSAPFNNSDSKSEIILHGNDFREVILWKANKNVSTVKSPTTSRSLLL